MLIFVVAFQWNFIRCSFYLAFLHFLFQGFFNQKEMSSKFSSVTAWSCDPPNEIFSLSSETSFTPPSTELSLVRLREDSPAKCNDGTASGYYIATSSFSSFSSIPIKKRKDEKQLWLIYLSGGGWCYDAKSCSDRWNDPSTGQGGYNGTFHMSSSVWNNTCKKSGIFSLDERNIFSHANKVYIPYCTSDAYMGNAERSKETNGWYFKGQSVIEEVLVDLHSRFQLGKGQNVIIFAGGSAGARGLVMNEEKIKTKIASFEGESDVYFIIDAGLWQDVDPLDPTKFVGFQYQTNSALHMTKASNLIPKECKLMYNNNLWKCLYTSYRYPYLKTPSFSMVSYYDKWQLPFNLEIESGIKATYPWSSQQEAYAKQFAKYTATYLQSSATNPQSFEINHSSKSIFGMSCYNHHVSESNEGYYEIKVGDERVTMAESVKHFVLNPFEPKVYLDTCVDFNCNPSCTYKKKKN